MTRRSAGLPAMITGILSADLEDEFFDRVVGDLQSIAERQCSRTNLCQGMGLPQVHALNCLKAILVETQFGTRTEAHIADLLDLATSCLNSYA